MGTRGAVCVKLDGELYATYNHFDSYPDGLGTDIVAFCKGVAEKQRFAIFTERFRHIVVVEEDGNPTPEEQQKYIDAGFYDASVGNQTSTDWYNLLRNLQGAAILDAILDGKCQHWIDGKDFLKDSLFCEYAYLIDLDAKELLFFKGFNKEPDENSPLPFEQVPINNYYPVRFQGKVALNAIPDDWEKQFYPEEDED